jgi:hypothetical protein
MKAALVQCRPRDKPLTPSLGDISGIQHRAMAEMKARKDDEAVLLFG